MTDKLESLLAANREWAASVTEEDPQFFERLAEGQSPDYLWIGCADSRVPATLVTGRKPGEMFVHRNVANMVVHTDLSCLTVMQYAVDVLKVKHIVVAGHYRCGGVAAAFGDSDTGLIDNWLRNIKDVLHRHQAEIDGLPDEQAKVDRLCELNVKAQVGNVCHTTVVQNAWRRAQPLTVHGLIYNLEDGLLVDLDCTVDGPGAIPAAYRVSG